VLDEAGKWAGTFTDLDKYASGQEIKYTVDEETVPADYAKNISGTAAEGYTITNSHEPGTTAVNVTKVWDDSDDQDGIRPASVKVQLYADGTAEGEAAELNEANSWTYGWAGLPEKKGGKTIDYTVKETAVPEGYTAEITGDAKSGYTITNSYTPEVTEVEVTKAWDDNDDQDKLRPASVEVQLYADGIAEGTAVELSAAAGWTHTWTALPKKAAGKEIKYTVDETEVPAEYTKKISGTAAAGYTITNTHTPGVTEVKVTKVWDDSEDADKLRPASVKVQLYADGKAEGTAVELSAATGWTHTWTALPKKAAGKEIAYTVDETAVPAEYTKTISGSAAAGYTITNSHTPATPVPPAPVPPTPTPPAPTPTPGSGGGGGTNHWPGFPTTPAQSETPTGVLGEFRLPEIVSAVLGDYRQPAVLGASRTGDGSALEFAWLTALLAGFGMVLMLFRKRKEHE